MKRMITLFAALMCCTMLCQAAPARKYVDASTLTIINKARQDSPAFERVTVSRYDMPKGAKTAFRQSTGLAVVFRTNSKNIHARWTSIKNQLIGNMTPVTQYGLDIYIRHEGRWAFAGVARPSTDPTSNSHTYSMVKNMTGEMHECMIYLSMYAGVGTLEIGVDEDATIEPIASPFEHKIVFVGSSITHGASASHPGNCFVARLGRMFNAETPNLGHSGQCKLQPHFVDMVCDTKADCFVFDAFSNSSDKRIEERLYNFVADIRKVHPATPLIFLQTLRRDHTLFNLRALANNEGQRAAAEREMRRVMRDFKDVYFINPGISVGNEGVATADGTHPSDLGMELTVKAVYPKMRKILRRYGIR